MYEHWVYDIIILSFQQQGGKHIKGTVVTLLKVLVDVAMRRINHVKQRAINPLRTGLWCNKLAALPGNV